MMKTNLLTKDLPLFTPVTIEQLRNVTPPAFEIGLPAGATPLWADESIRAYWAEEVRLGSPALGRLESICRAHGWDYAATVEALAQ